jgi:EcsC protein family
MQSPYEIQVRKELAAWQKKMRSRPSLFSKLSKKVQGKINSWIPEKVHKAITVTIKQLIRGVLFGAKYTTGEPTLYISFEEQEAAILKKIENYRTTAAVEGGITGGAGILLGLADFPILIGIKLKLLFEIGNLYNFDMDDYKERVYLLHIFDWETKKQQLPDSIHQFDWRNFQQEYRDYIDIAKLAQLIPVIGAPVGVIVNYRLIKKLGKTAMNAYRMRLVER